VPRALAREKCPRLIDFKAELPRPRTGKLYKGLLRDLYWGVRKSRILRLGGGHRQMGCRVDWDPEAVMEWDGSGDRFMQGGSPQAGEELKSIAFYREAICALLRRSSRDRRHSW
jgi:hypothetical protein